jgi:hypothetical protein
MKKLLLTMLSITLITGNNAYAVTEAEEKVVLVEKDFPAPYKGYLFPEDKALKFRRDLLELDTLRELKTSYERTITLYKTNDELHNYRVNMLLDQNDKLAKAVYQSKDRESWENWMWFAAGVLVTGIGVGVGLRNR